ncbi:hypothetical protein, partial [Burkholderia glumae]|uniref:hypothetical protein n=1 Tax=Burkholderia glumae TaxID=337 RepID=UPI001E4DE290
MNADLIFIDRLFEKSKAPRALFLLSAAADRAPLTGRLAAPHRRGALPMRCRSGAARFGRGGSGVRRARRDQRDAGLPERVA